MKTLMASEQPRIYKSYPSPDGNLLAQITIYECAEVNLGSDPNAYEQLKLIGAGNGEERLADSQLQNCGGVGAFGLGGLYWSTNSRYFYYTNAREGYPDGLCGFWERPIVRLEVSSLKKEELGAGPVSPDRTKLATWLGKDLIILDMNQGREIGHISPHILNQDTGTGPIVWSPDSQALVYIQPESFCPLSGNSLVVYVDLQTFEQRLLLEPESPTFGTANWEKNNELTLTDESGKQWIYDFVTQKLKRY